jgi:hypothetical protein
MADLGEKIKISLDECRMLVLGTQVLISLQFELAFQNAFADAPSISQKLVAVGLGLLLLTFILLLWGPAYHRIAGRGKSDPSTQQFLTWSTCLALWPLSIALAVDAFISVDKLGGSIAGIAIAIAVAVLCAVCWYGLGMLARKSCPQEVSAMKEKPDDENKPEPAEKKLHEEVSMVLTEARVVLPGAQAMLGFQFVTMFTHEFDGLPASSKFIHLASLGLIALTVVLLMTPAAFHRIAEGGEDSPLLVQVAGRLVLAAMVPLGLGMSGDFFVIVRKISGSATVAAIAGSAAALLCFGLWFAYTTYRRKLRTPSRDSPTGALAHFS